MQGMKGTSLLVKHHTDQETPDIDLDFQTEMDWHQGSKLDYLQDLEFSSGTKLDAEDAKRV
jgi:hypothetical protein